MSELPIGWAGGINACYVYSIRLKDCIKRETFYQLMCRDEQEDFLECKTGKRNV
jgi:hypothetical protein